MKNFFDEGYYNYNQLKKIGFKKIGTNVKISKTCVIIGLKNISLGKNIRIDSYTTIIADKGYLKIGNNFHLGSHSHILCAGGIKINNNCTISQGVRIYSQSDDYSGKYPTGIFNKKKYLYYVKGKVEIGEKSIIGSGSVILPKVKIEKKCSVGALSLVNKSLKLSGVYGGIPCKIIRKRKWKNMILLF